MFRKSSISQAATRRRGTTLKRVALVAMCAVIVSLTGAVTNAAQAASSGTLGFAQIEGYWVAAGGPSSQAATAAAITGAESGYKPGIIQAGQPYSTTGWGLWQITPGNSVSQFGQDYQLLDPWNNAEAAVAKYKAAGNSFKPWTTYNTGAYRSFLPANPPAPATGLSDPGQYVSINGAPAGTHNTSQPGTTYGPPMPGSTAFQIAFQANTGSLWVTKSDSTSTNWALGMMAGTSPAITAVPGGYETAFQANDGSLWAVGNAGNIHYPLGMKAGTSPSIAALSGGGFEVAFQANTGSLWTVNDKSASSNWALGMMAGTSPSITAVSGGYEVAFQANNGDLWAVGNGGNIHYSLGMKTGTSPSITALSAGGFEIAFQANSGSLWTVNNQSAGTNWALGMMAGTSPSITAVSGGFETAFEANDGSLWAVGNSGNTHFPLGMKVGTSPSITSLSSGYEVAFQSNGGNLWAVKSDSTSINFPLGMNTGTSPAITHV